MAPAPCVDVELTRHLGDADVRARASAVADRLRRSPNASRQAFGARMREEASAPDIERAKASLPLGLRMYYAGRDTVYEELAAWERRISGLATVAVVPARAGRGSAGQRFDPDNAEAPAPAGGQPPGPPPPTGP